jgi:hypothetical protein
MNEQIFQGSNTVNNNNLKEKNLISERYKNTIDINNVNNVNNINKTNDNNNSNSKAYTNNNINNNTNHKIKNENLININKFKIDNIFQGNKKLEINNKENEENAKEK